MGDTESLLPWEDKVLSEGTPLSTFHAQWSRVRQEEKRKAIKDVQDKDYDFIPKLKKKEQKSNGNGGEEDFSGLWEEDDSDEDKQVIFALLTSLARPIDELVFFLLFSAGSLEKASGRKSKT